MSSGWYFWISHDSPIVPAVGMPIRLYGKGIGHTVRGVFLEGVRVYYRTEAEQDEEHRRWCEDREKERRRDFEKNQADLDRRYRQLPRAFRMRLDRFRANNPDFRWEYEPYELFCCEQAVVIAHALEECPGAGATSYQGVFAEFRAMTWEQQKARVPGLADGHSGNTFGIACLLARLYLVRPEDVAGLHGALAPLVGSREYGCVPREGGSTG